MTPITARSLRSRPINLCALFVSCLAAAPVHAEDWTCTDVASVKDGNTVLVCGVATADNEGDAREQALLHAKREFELVCEGSADCRDFETNIEPLRNTCSKEADGKTTCFRGLRYVILDQKKAGVASPRVVAQTPQPSFQAPQPQPAPSVAKRAPFGIGVSTYSVTIKDSSSPQSATEFSGNAAWLSYAFNSFINARAALYELENDKRGVAGKVDDFKVTGRDLQLIIGGYMDRAGWRIYGGVGSFSEKWNEPVVNEIAYSGGELILGLGYNWDHVTVEWSGALRNKEAYGAAANSQVSATSSALILTLRL